MLVHQRVMFFVRHSDGSSCGVFYIGETGRHQGKVICRGEVGNSRHEEMTKSSNGITNRTNHSDFLDYGYSGYGSFKPGDVSSGKAEISRLLKIGIGYNQCMQM